MLKNNIIYPENFLTTYSDILKPNSIDLIVTDPPYFILNESWDKGNFAEFTKTWLNICYDVLKPGGTMWSFMGYERHFEYHDILKNVFNRKIENDVVWARSKGRSSEKHLKSLREDIFYAYKDGNDIIWNNLKMIREVIAPYMKDGRPRGWFIDETGKRMRWTGLGNVWMYSQPTYNSVVEVPIHPTQKPVMLMERLIRLSSNEGDIILDPFMGSGTTAISCLLSNRKYIGFEYTKKYYNDSINRINNFNKLDYYGYNLSTDIEIIKSGNKLNSNIPKKLIESIKNKQNNSFF